MFSVPFADPNGHPAERHVVLVAPEIHWNTGNISRTCLAVGARLHLIKPLGFSLDSRQVRRAGLDYWPKVDISVWDDFGRFIDRMDPAPEELFLFTKTGHRLYWDMPRRSRMFLVFGSETRGLPREILKRHRQQTFRIPISTQIRSLNLSTAAGIALYESLRPCGLRHGQPV